MSARGGTPVPDPPEAPTYYPVYLDLRGRLCVVVDGQGQGEAHGQAALWKAEGLVAGGARVRLVSESPSPELAAFVASHPEVEHRARGYRPGDLAGAFLAISVDASPEVAGPFWEEAQALGIPANVMDDVPRCSFIAPSIVRRGDLAVAISTAGRAPALAVRLRERLERELGDHHARFLEIAGALRAPMLERHPPFERRRELWYRLVDSDVLDLLARGDEAAAVERIEAITGIDLTRGTRGARDFGSDPPPEVPATSGTESRGSGGGVPLSPRGERGIEGVWGDPAEVPATSGTVQ